MTACSGSVRWDPPEEYAAREIDRPHEDPEPR
jgi:hypothetical protein